MEMLKDEALEKIKSEIKRLEMMRKSMMKQAENCLGSSIPAIQTLGNYLLVVSNELSKSRYELSMCIIDCCEEGICTHRDIADDIRAERSEELCD